MQLIVNQILLLSIAIGFSNCSKKNTDSGLYQVHYSLTDVAESNVFTPVEQHVLDPNLKELSGLVCGRKNPECVYFIEDKGNSSAVHVFTSTGIFKSKLLLNGVQNIDFEDLTIGPGPIDGETYIYIGDIGDNDNNRSQIRILRFPEPDLSGNVPATITIENIEIINVKYPDGPKDAETLMIHPITKDLIIMSKRESQTMVYRLNYPYNQPMNEPLYLGSLPLKKLVAGDISNDGQRFAVKNKSTIYFWQTADNDIYKTMFHTAPKKVAYIPEPQGESLGFSMDGKSYFTVSETKDHAGAEPILYRYFEN